MEIADVPVSNRCRKRAVLMREEPRPHGTRPAGAAGGGCLSKENMVSRPVVRACAYP